MPNSEWEPPIAALIAKLERIAKFIWIAAESPVADDVAETCLAAASALRGVRVTTDQEDHKPTRVDWE